MLEKGKIELKTKLPQFISVSINVEKFPILAVYFFAISMGLREYHPEERTVKITKPLSVIVNLVPLMGIVILGILFTFVLKGRLLERGTHAFLVFALWMYATRFYQYILSYYNKKLIFAGSAIGMIFSIILAVLFTPLDRYVSLIYFYINWCSIFLGCVLFITFYAVTFMAVKRVRQDK